MAVTAVANRNPWWRHCLPAVVLCGLCMRKCWRARSLGRALHGAAANRVCVWSCVWSIDPACVGHQGNTSLIVIRLTDGLLLCAAGGCRLVLKRSRSTLGLRASTGRCCGIGSRHTCRARRSSRQQQQLTAAPKQAAPTAVAQPGLQHSTTTECIHVQLIPDWGCEAYTRQQASRCSPVACSPCGHNCCHLIVIMLRVACWADADEPSARF